MTVGQRRVLVVDDSDADQFLSKLMIRRFDPSIQVLQAYDGREALAVLDAMEEPPDAVFLDINMPVMNGHEFLAALHERDRRRVHAELLRRRTRQRELSGV